MRVSIQEFHKLYTVQHSYYFYTNSRVLILMSLKWIVSIKAETPGPHYTLFIQVILKFVFMNTGAKFIQRNMFIHSHS